MTCSVLKVVHRCQIQRPRCAATIAHRIVVNLDRSLVSLGSKCSTCIWVDGDGRVRLPRVLLLRDRRCVVGHATAVDDVDRPTCRAFVAQVLGTVEQTPPSMSVREIYAALTNSVRGSRTDVRRDRAASR
jgi:hypothetical protein